MTQQQQHIPLDERDPQTVRAVILARSSDTGAKPEDMATQVAECREFIAAMGWPAVPDQLVFTEIKSGVRAIARPIIDEVLALCQRGAIDVVVCREWERVARVKARRYQIVLTAEDFGVEFRYANLAKDRGKMPDTLEARIMRDVLEELGQVERDKIVERTGGGKRRRLMEGLPTGGRYGPLYGYAPGDRRVKNGRQVGCLNWIIHEDKARWVRWLYETVAATAPPDLSLRWLTSEVERRGAPMASGRGHWDVSHVRHILRNPMYCGRGRTGRYTSEWVRERDATTGRVRDVKRKHDRLSNPETWREQTYPVPEAVVPPIITPDLWDRAQEVLDAAAALHNRGGPRRTDAAAHSTLLDGGYIFCAVCGRKLTRFWQKRDGHPYYQCHPTAGVPHHEHGRQTIVAAKVDNMVLATLARALTDPEELLLLADAAATARQRAEADLALAQAQDAATAARLADLTTEQEHVLTALTALAQVPGMDSEVARLRVRSAALDAERHDLLTIREEVYVHDTTARATILRSLFTTRDLMFTPTGGLEEIGDGYLSIGYRMTTAQAAVYLDKPEGSDLGVPIQAGAPFTYETDDGTRVADVMADTVLTADVLYARLRQLPRERLRELLRAHDVKVRVKPPRPRTEWAEYGPTPATERVEIILHDSLVLRPSQIGRDGDNLSRRTSI